jgi:hypothetical protein
MDSFVLSSRVERVINFDAGGCSDLFGAPSALLSELFFLRTEEIISLKLSLITGAELVAIVTPADATIGTLESVCPIGL